MAEQSQLCRLSEVEEVRLGMPRAGKSFLGFAQKICGVVKVAADFLATGDLEVGKVLAPAKVSEFLEARCSLPAPTVREKPPRPIHHANAEAFGDAAFQLGAVDELRRG